MGQDNIDILFINIQSLGEDRLQVGSTNRLEIELWEIIKLGAQKA